MPEYTGSAPEFLSLGRAQATAASWPPPQPWLNAHFLQRPGAEPAAGVSAVGVNALADAVVHLA